MYLRTYVRKYIDRELMVTATSQLYIILVGHFRNIVIGKRAI